MGTRFSVRPDRPWGPPSVMYNGYRVFHGGRGGRGVGLTLPPPSSAEGPRKSRAIPLLALRSLVACKKSENLPTFSMNMRNKQCNFPYVMKTSLVFIAFTTHTQRNVFETEIKNHCVFCGEFSFFFFAIKCYTAVQIYQIMQLKKSKFMDHK